MDGEMPKNGQKFEGGGWGEGQGGSPELSAPFQFPWEMISFCYFIFFREIQAFSSFGFSYFVMKNQTQSFSLFL
jgi:hypothetical protein